MQFYKVFLLSLQIYFDFITAVLHLEIKEKCDCRTFTCDVFVLFTLCGIVTSTNKLFIVL